MDHFGHFVSHTCSAWHVFLGKGLEGEVEKGSMPTLAAGEKSVHILNGGHFNESFGEAQKGSM